MVYGAPLLAFVVALAPAIAKVSDLFTDWFSQVDKGGTFFSCLVTGIVGGFAKLADTAVQVGITFQSVFADVEKALIALQKFTLQERLQQQVVAASREAFNVAEKQLNGGTINLITVLQAEQTLFTAENNLVLVRLSKFQAAVSLFQALGGGWTPGGTLASLN